jgi:hypothetical protein
VEVNRRRVLRLMMWGHSLLFDVFDVVFDVVIDEGALICCVLRAT